MSSKLLYVSPEEADSYATGREETLFWFDLADPEKLSVLSRAGELLDARIIWKGTPAKPDQTLRWPRSGIFDADGLPVSETAIPDAVKHAVCEQAFAMCDPQRKKFRKLRLSGVKSASMGGLSVSVGSGESESGIAKVALEWIRAFGRLRSGGTGGSVCGAILRG